MVAELVTSRSRNSRGQNSRNHCTAGIFLTLMAGRAEPSQQDEDESALRWRSVILRLSENVTQAARMRPDLAPILWEALDHALEQLLMYGCEKQLMMLEQWLAEDKAPRNSAPARNSAPDSVASCSHAGTVNVGTVSVRTVMCSDAK